MLTDKEKDELDQPAETVPASTGDEDPDLAWFKAELEALIADAACFLEIEEIAAALDRAAKAIREKAAAK